MARTQVTVTLTRTQVDELNLYRREVRRAERRQLTLAAALRELADAQLETLISEGLLQPDDDDDLAGS